MVKKTVPKKLYPKLDIKDESKKGVMAKLGDVVKYVINCCKE